MCEVSWTCPSLEEMAYGSCTGPFGSFGDRFVQIDSWRLAAIDARCLGDSSRLDLSGDQVIQDLVVGLACLICNLKANSQPKPRLVS